MATNSRQLLIKVQAQAAQALREMDRAEKGVKKFTDNSNRHLNRFDKRQAQASRNLKRFAGPAVMAGVVAGLTVAVKRAIGFADEIGKTADRIGVSTRALQEYRLAGELAGVEVSKMDKGLEQFAKRIGEGAAGTGSLVEFLKRSDQAFLDNVLSAGSVDQALEMVINRMSEMGSATDRAALANAAFGRSGIAMTNIARDNAAALVQARAAAEHYGLVITDSLVRQAEAANDQLTLVSRALSVNMTKALVAVAPLILELGAAFAEAAPEIARFFAMFGGDAFAPLEDIIAKRDKLFKEARGVVLDAGLGGIFEGQNMSAPDEVQVRLRPLLEEVDALTKIIDRRQALQKVLDEAGSGDAGGTATTTAGPAAADKAGDVVAALKAEAEAIGMTAAQLAVLNQLKAAGLDVSEVVLTAEGDLVGEYDKETEAIAGLTRQIIERTKAEEDRAALEGEILALQESLKTEEEQRAEVLERLAEAEREKIITAEERIEIEKRLADQLKDTGDSEEELRRQKEEALRQARRMRDATVDLAEALSDHLGDALSGSIKGWKEWLAFSLHAITDVLRAWQRMQDIQGGSGGGGGGTSAGGLISAAASIFGAVAGGAGAGGGGRIGGPNTGNSGFNSVAPAPFAVPDLDRLQRNVSNTNSQAISVNMTVDARGAAPGVGVEIERAAGQALAKAGLDPMGRTARHQREAAYSMMRRTGSEAV